MSIENHSYCGNPQEGKERPVQGFRSLSLKIRVFPCLAVANFLFFPRCPNPLP